MNFNDQVSAVSNLSVLMSKFDVMRPCNFHKVLKTSVTFLVPELQSSIVWKNDRKKWYRGPGKKSIKIDKICDVTW